MKMAQKHLHELLEEDQEPFQLKNYIADRCCQLKRSSSSSSSLLPPKTDQLHLQVKKRKPISSSSNFPSSSYFCKNACFNFSNFHDSPDPRKSPLKSPCRPTPNNNNAIFLNIPARTAALLLDAALRIQKHTSKPKNGFGLFGSLRKKLTYKIRARKRNGEEDEDGASKVSVKDILRWDSYHEKIKQVQIGSEVGFSCTTVWSESNKSSDLDLETSSSCSSHSVYFEEIEFLSSKDKESTCECESPFRFVLQKSPSSGHRTPVFTSPATSPSRHKFEEEENHEIEILKKFNEEEEEEKEQCSPVSVLDPPFEDDDDEEGHDEDGDDFELECSFAIVQRAKQQLLHKLRRFEKLAELDPIELENRMLEQEEGDDIYDIEEEEDNVDGFVEEIISNSSIQDQQRRVPEDMKRLVEDLIAEEEREHNWCRDREMVVKRVCRRLESWKEVECNTIDMMVEKDFKTEGDGWIIRNKEQVGETAIEIEMAIFGLLMEELMTEEISF